MAVERARRDGLDPRRVAVVAATASIAGVIGARMWSVLLEHWPLHGELHADSIWTTSGLGLFGGLVMGAVATVALSHRLGVSKESIADAMAPGVAVGISVGRIGCLLAGCCYGLPTLFPVAIVVSDFDAATRPLGLPRHPSALYESVLAAILAAGLWQIPAGRAPLRLGVLLAGYGALRLAIEPLRDDYRGTLGSVPTPVVASLVALAIGAMIMGAALRRRRRDRVRT